MGLSPKEQIIDQITKSETILLCVNKNPNGDALGAALGLYLALKKLGKKTDIVSPTAILEKYSFLPSSNLITHKLEGARDYIFSVDIKKDKLQQLRYEVQDNKLKIFITTKSSDLNEKDVTLESSKFKYDLIIILGTSDLENLGDIYDNNPELFYEAPVINIDNNPSNEYFGKINLVDVATSSTSEIVYNIITNLDEKLFNNQIATNLLAGIISKTNSFQNKNTTPKAFLAAASLITKGANKEDIIRYLYKTKSISIIKLMGVIMSTLKYNSQYKLGWSIITKNELERTNATPENLSLVVNELANSSPEFDMMLLLYKNNGKINGIVNFSEKLETSALTKLLNGTIQDSQIIFVSSKTAIDLAEKETLKKIKEWKDGMSI
ncbi:MAG: DHH family phosphoesterase [Patescibacteria group bacterium]|nr:DHH family phosphoesterase [Patescibacteria group bacterium]